MTFSEVHTQERGQPTEMFTSVLILASVEDEGRALSLCTSLSSAVSSIPFTPLAVRASDSVAAIVRERDETPLFVIVLVSRSAIRTDWYAKELPLLSHLGLPEARLLLVPIWLGDGTPPLILQQRLLLAIPDDAEEPRVVSRLAGLIREGWHPPHREPAVLEKRSDCQNPQLLPGSRLSDGGYNSRSYKVARSARMGSPLGMLLGFLWFGLALVGLPVELRLLGCLVGLGVMVLSFLVLMGTTYLLQAYNEDVNLVFALDQMERDWVPFGELWKQKLSVGAHNEDFRIGHHLEALAGIVMLCTGGLLVLLLLGLLAAVGS